jgi:regulation of enolase protein 1 (concanavalin A-like superfamily)
MGWVGSEIGDWSRSCTLRLSAIVVAISLALAIAVVAQDQPTTAVRSAPRAIPGRYIVVLHGRDDPEAVGLEVSQTAVGRLRHVYRSAVQGFTVEMSAAAAEALTRDPRVSYVQQDGVVHLTNTQSDAPWNLDRIDQRTREDGAYHFDADGSGVHAYVIDTGIRTTHHEFGGRASEDFTTINDGRGAQDCYGHGTHVAAILGGRTYGVAKNVSLHSVRVFDCDAAGTWSGVLAAIDWVTENHLTPAVVNMSLGGPLVDAVNDAVRKAIAAGVPFAISAGNDDHDACDNSPASVVEALVVGAVDERDQRASYSNFGRCVDLFAPGDAILSAGPLSDTETVVLSGTSMAAPHVAGAVALYLQHHSHATPAQVTTAILAGATSNAVHDTMGSPNRLLFTGYLGDRKKPHVVLVSPSAGDAVAGSVVIRANASDDTAVARVTFYAGSSRIATDSSSPYSASWDTTTVANGLYDLHARVEDFAGNGADSAAVTVRVANHTHTGLILPWTSTPVGQVSAKGGASYASGAFTVVAGDGSVWDRADAFQFVHRAWSGDADLVAKTADLFGQSDASSAQAGLMFRDGLGAAALEASVLISTEGKVKFRRRVSAGGVTASDGSTGTTSQVPRWVKLTRRGNVFAAYVSPDGLAWSAVYTAQTIRMAQTIEVGVFALRSGGTELATATFDTVQLSAPLTNGWSSTDVGAVGAAGRTTITAGRYTLSVGGTMLWGGQDAFHLVYRHLTGNGAIIARLIDLVSAPGRTATLGGITMRESLDEDAAHVSMIITTEGKAKFRRRLTSGGDTLSDGPSSGAVDVPQWLKIARAGNAFRAYVSDQGTSWEQVGETQSVAMGSTVYVGLIGLRTGGSSTGSVVFSDVTVK